MRRFVVTIGTAMLLLALIAPPAGSMPARRELPSARPGQGLKAPKVVTDNFEVVGHTDLGNRDTNGDVWVHGDFAYVGTWGDPCDGAGVKIVDVSDPAHPKLIGHVGARKFTSAEDVVVRSVDSASFSGDLLAVGIQRCGGGKALDHAKFGAQFWDVTDPSHPERLGKIGSTTGFGGVHELDLFQQGSNIYALFATPDSEYFDDKHEGDFRIVDVTDPRAPKQIAEWGALENGMADGPWDGLGSLGHGVRAQRAGERGRDEGVRLLLGPGCSDVRHHGPDRSCADLADGVRCRLGRRRALRDRIHGRTSFPPAEPRGRGQPFAGAHRLRGSRHDRRRERVTVRSRAVRPAQPSARSTGRQGEGSRLQAERLSRVDRGSDRGDANDLHGLRRGEDGEAGLQAGAPGAER